MVLKKPDMMKLYGLRFPFLLLPALLSGLLSCSHTGSGRKAEVHPAFRYHALDTTVALHPVFDDLDGNGSDDLLIVTEYVDETGDDASKMKYISLYPFPEHGRNDLLYTNYRSCDLKTRDLDLDGDADIIGRTSDDQDENNAYTFWMENPGTPVNSERAYWPVHRLGMTDYIKDFDTGFVDSDSLPDIIGRTHDTLYVYLNTPAGNWRTLTFAIHPHEGMECADLDGDGDTDIALNGYWLETVPDNGLVTWKEHLLGRKWYDQQTGNWADNNCRVSVADMNADGRTDILISNSEKPGYPVCWYEAPENRTTDPWQEHVIGYVDYCHTLIPADMDLDGDPDVVTGELIHSRDPAPGTAHPVQVFYNLGKGLTWDVQVLDTLGIYAAEVGDFDRDGDPDIVGPRNYNLGPLRLFENTLVDKK